MCNFFLKFTGKCPLAPSWVANHGEWTILAVRNAERKWHKADKQIGKVITAGRHNGVIGFGRGIWIWTCVPSANVFNFCACNPGWSSWPLRLSFAIIDWLTLESLHHHYLIISLPNSLDVFSSRPRGSLDPIYCMAIITWSSYCWLVWFLPSL